MSSGTIVLYHANCQDGFGSAWAAHGVLGDDNAVYIPVQYGQSPPPEILGGIENLYILDFSYDRPTLGRLAECCKRITVLDHHKTAAEELAGLPFATFDMDRSGAVLAWEHFHPGKPVPRLLAYVQDRDLWRWELPFSREVSAALSMEPKDFGRWSDIATQLEDGQGFIAFADRGSIILSHQKQIVGSLCGFARPHEISGHSVPAVNSPIFQSEIGHELLKRHPDAPFAAIYFHTSVSEIVWSLRSRGDFDVSTVAKANGGGGHPAAAGFKVGA